MTKTEIQKQEDFFYMILQFKTEFPDAFTDGEQICINQWRAILQRELDLLDGKIEESEISDYVLPESIIKKIKATHILIEKKGWKPKPNLYE